MSGVRVLVGTKKGAFILTADGRRKNWNASGPLFAGWDRRITTPTSTKPFAPSDPSGN